jgi:addiction module RelE/StbE family toxin
VKPIEPSRSFVKSYAKRIIKDQKLRKQYEVRISMFMTGHRTAPLNDHALTGDLQGRRSLSITGDVRVIYIELEDKIILLDVGTHNQVY